MKKTRLCSLFFATALAIGCEEPTSSDSVINAVGGSGTGGKVAMGGVTATGGNTATGGSVMTGSVDAKDDTMTMASGGIINTGGADATGGIRATGDAKATGGDMATGGAKATGGTTTMGGAKATGGTTAMGGAKATGGTSATGGTKSTGGTTATSGSSSSSSGSSSVSCSTSLPSAKGTKTISSSQSVSGTFDGGMVQFCGSGSLGGSGQNEGQGALFNVANGGTLKNVIIGGSGCAAADGVHCAGSCTLENVWWGDVGEDAATFRGGSTRVVIKGGGAFNASDKVFQDNTTGGSSVTITNFFVGTAGKLYRSCGTCAKADRHVIMQNIAYKNVKQVAGLNSNNGDTAKMSGLTDCGGGAIVCADYSWVAKGSDPPRNGECKY